MARWFNIDGPCNPAKHYMLSAMERLPEAASLVRKEQYFVVHAPRQCGKTTAFQALADEINVRMKVPENPWVRDDGLDMPGLMAAFQQFWCENASESAVPFQYREAYPHLVLQAFLQRVINGGGQIVREMALGSGRLDLGVHFRGAVYAVEVKTHALYEKSPEKAHAQVCGYVDRLGQREGWLVVVDSDLTKPWDGKISSEEISLDGKAIHVVRC